MHSAAAAYDVSAVAGIRLPRRYFQKVSRAVDLSQKTINPLPSEAPSATRATSPRPCRRTVRKCCGRYSRYAAHGRPMTSTLAECPPRTRCAPVVVRRESPSRAAIDRSPRRLSPNLVLTMGSDLKQHVRRDRAYQNAVQLGVDPLIERRRRAHRQIRSRHLRRRYDAGDSRAVQDPLIAGLHHLSSSKSVSTRVACSTSAVILASAMSLAVIGKLHPLMLN